MLLTIHNLPAATRYADIKSLLQSKCGLKHVILDNLVSEGGGKKVTVGVAEDEDAAFLVRKINGLYWNGMQLYVEDVRQQKKPSEQPFHSTNTQLQQHTEPSFRSMNLQQDSGYAKGVPIADNKMAPPAVQPMMSAMYYVPNYTNNMQTESFGGFMQTDKGYVQHSETVQSGYMGIGAQSATQISQFGMTQYNEILSQPEKRLGWGEDYNVARDFAAEKPIFKRRSSAKSREENWFNNQQNRRQESPSRGVRDPSWTLGGSDNRPTQPDFRSSIRPTQPDFRSNIRPEEHSGFVKPTPNFRPNDHSEPENPARREFLFSERSSEFSGRPNEVGGFSGRQNDRQRKPNESERFSGRLNEFSGRSSDYQEPNKFSGRHNDRQGRLNEFSGRQKKFSGRPNEFSGRPNEFSGRPNEFSGRPNEFSGRPNEFSRRPNVFSGKPNNRQGRPNEFSERQQGPHERQGKPNNRPEPSRSHERAEYSEDRPGYGWLNERPTFSKRGGRANRGHPSSALPDSRKRKFEVTPFENRKVERPERLSRPETWRQHPAPSPNQFREHNDTKKFAPRPFVTSKAKPMSQDKMRQTAVRYVINDMHAHLGIRNPNFITRQMSKNLITKRMFCLNLNKTVVTPHKCFEAYRAKYPRTEYKATYDTILGLIAQRFADEANGGTVPGGPSKHKQNAGPKQPDAFNPAATKLTKEEKQAARRIRLAQRLMAKGRLSSFPLGDKKKFEEYIQEEQTGYIPEVDSHYKAAIEDEIRHIIDIFRQEFEKATSGKFQEVCNKVLPVELTDEMEMLLIRGLSRRVTESGLKVIRLYGRPKLPKRPVIEKFLQRFGPQSLRKSQRAKMYTVSVDTYKNYDKLCAMQSAKVEGDITLFFKPFLLAPKLKTNTLLLKLVWKKLIQDMIDTSDLNLLDKDWPAKEAEIKAKEAEIEAKEAEIKAKEAETKAKEAEIKAKKAEEQLAKRINAVKEAKQQNDVAEIITTDTKKQNEEAILNDNNVLQEDKDLIDKNDESNTEINGSNDYLHEDFHVIDEVNETDSDIEYIDKKVVNIDEDNDLDKNNDPENDKSIEDDAADLETDDEDLDIDDVNVNLDDIDDDDLEDY